ncbi:1505_t:CDS:10 [Paraglomus occultum]|uniref:1505_t:CDS:1 n=1 Tax=Paraglomus occultum TaxID=144539 RepID=A0A9N8ZFC7_9GLOM|nr:1505_t:CDS:10 [Paraglomus occultum]
MTEDVPAKKTKLSAREERAASTLLPRNFRVHDINAPIAFFVPSHFSYAHILSSITVTLESIIHNPIPQMQLSPECRNSINFSDFWASVDEPSLRKFLDFRLSAGDLNDESEEHHRYISELKTIKKYYAEASEMGRNISKWINRFKSASLQWEPQTTLQSASLQWEPRERNSFSVKTFWEFQQQKYNIDVKRQLIREEGLLDFEETGLRRLHDASSAIHNDHLQHYKQRLSKEEIGLDVQSRYKDSVRKRPCPLDIVVEDSQKVPSNRSTQISSEKRLRFEDSSDEDATVKSSSSDFSYHPENDSDNSDDTDSVVSDQNEPKKPKDRLEWLVGLGDEEWVLDKDAHQWVVGDANVTMMLMKYRQSSVQKAYTNNIETAAEILSLNHIFLFEDETGIWKRLAGESWKTIFNSIKTEFVTSQLSDYDLLRCHTMSNTASGTFADCKLLLRKWQQQVVVNEDIVLELFESILQRPSLWNSRSVTEDTFVHEALAPVLSPFFVNEFLICDWSTDILESSANRKKKLDPSLKGRGRKPDLTVSIYVINNRKENVLVTEVKSPKYRGKKLPDLIKLGNEMKDSLDKMVDDGIFTEDVVVCGILVHGLLCSAYAMDLKYDGVYRMILLGRFYLPRDHNDFGVFPRTIEILMQVKKLVLHTYNLCLKSLQMSTHAESEIVASCRTPPRRKMVRFSFHSPIKVPLNKGEQQHQAAWQFESES